MEEKILVVGDKKFRLIPQENVGEEELICDTRCSYSDICNHLPNPRNPEDPELSFEDLCGELGEMEKPGQDEEDPGRAKLFNSIPAPGSLETIYILNSLNHEYERTNKRITEISSIRGMVRGLEWLRRYLCRRRSCFSV